jgi:hypothetical protein
VLSQSEVTTEVRLTPTVSSALSRTRQQKANPTCLVRR